MTSALHAQTLYIGPKTQVESQDFENLILHSLDESIGQKSTLKNSLSLSQRIIGLSIDTKAGLWSWNKGIETAIEFRFYPENDK